MRRKLSVTLWAPQVTFAGQGLTLEQGEGSGRHQEEVENERDSGCEKETSHDLGQEDEARLFQKAFSVAMDLDSHHQKRVFLSRDFGLDFDKGSCFGCDCDCGCGWEKSDERQVDLERQVLFLWDSYSCCGSCCVFVSFHVGFCCDCDFCYGSSCDHVREFDCGCDSCCVCFGVVSVGFGSCFSLSFCACGRWSVTLGSCCAFYSSSMEQGQQQKTKRREKTTTKKGGRSTVGEMVSRQEALVKVGTTLKKDGKQLHCHPGGLRVVAKGLTSSFPSLSFVVVAVLPPIVLVMSFVSFFFPFSFFRFHFHLHPKTKTPPAERKACRKHGSASRGPPIKVASHQIT